MKILLAYLLVINAVSLLLMLTDKQKARRGAWRIPERVLLGSAVIGGSVGAIAGMYLFRHKTKHPQFYIGLPVILALQIVAAVLIVMTTAK